MLGGRNLTNGLSGDRLRSLAVPGQSPFWGPRGTKHFVMCLSVSKHASSMHRSMVPASQTRINVI